MTTININISRLDHLLKLYRLSKKELLTFINESAKKIYTENDVFKTEIKISVLKKIDLLFNKGLNYYIDTKVLKESKEESIFFRKDKFNAELNIGAKKVVNYFEEEKIAFSALSKLSDLKTERVLPFYTVKNSPHKVANEIRQYLYPIFNKDRKAFLKSLISKFAEHGVLVFEFVETWNKKEKANINGFYLAPNVIVLKRQKSFRREIFTLIHELGHYLLNIEEIDEKVSDDFLTYDSLNAIEKWCNDFAYYFLIGDLDKKIVGLDKASALNDYHHTEIANISDNTNLSIIALFTRLRINGKISYTDYKAVQEEFAIAYLENEANTKRQRELEKEDGRKSNARTAKPILSPLYVSTIQSAFIEGVINESEFCRRLNVKPENIEKYLK